MHPLVREMLEQHAAQLRTLCRAHGVRRLALFGSSLSESWDTLHSDLDFVAEFGPPPPGVDLFAQFFVFQTKLEALFGRKVDLIEKRAVRKPHLLELLENQSESVYAA